MRNEFDKVQAVKALYPPGSLVRLQPLGELWRVIGYEASDDLFGGGHVTLARRSLPTDKKIMQAIELQQAISE